VKILVVTDRFVPEVTAPSVRIMDHARVWLELGHEVTVVTCAPNVPRGIVFDGYENRLYQEEWLEGIRTIRVGSYMTANEGFLKRSLDYLSFMLSSVVQCRRYPDFDVILATSPPLFTALGGYLVSRCRKRPWVFEVRDLWPASIKAVGVSNSRLIDVLEKLELFLYHKADRIISLTRSFKQDLTQRGIPAGKNDVITNSVDTAQFNDERIAFDARDKLGISKGDFLVGYVGTTGLAQGLTTLLDAAAITRDDPDLKYVIIGEGAERASLESEARRRGLGNLLFRDFVPHDEMPAYLASMDASLVHLRPDPLFRTVIPSKIFEAMAMGVPILLGVEGESAEIIDETGSGLCFQPGSPEELVAAVRRLASDPSLREEISRKGRAAAYSVYGRRAMAEHVIDTLQTAIDSRAGRRR